MTDPTDELGRVIDRLEWLSPVETALQSVANVLINPLGQTVRNLLHGTWLGHPLHPAIVGVPIGAWSVSAVLDAVELATGERDTRAGADAALVIGIAGAAGAAVTGLADWQYTHKPARRVGAAHATFHASALACYLFSLDQRRRGNRLEGIVAGLLGYGLMMTGAYLGGHLSYHEKIGMDQGQHGVGPRDWTTVLPDKELLDGEMHAVHLEGADILIARRYTKLFAISDKCPHLGGPLSKGEFREHCVTCPWHGSRFSLEDGQVMAGPAVYNVETFEVRTHEGNIEVRRARAADAAGKDQESKAFTL